MRKKLIYTISSVILVALLLLSIGMPKKEFSERENRYLESFPKFSVKKLITGDFSNSLSSYSQDHFAFRDFWVRVNTKMKILLNQKEINGVYICKDDYLIEEYKGGNFVNIAKVVNSFCDKVAAKVSFMAVPSSIAINSDKLPNGVNGKKEIEDLALFYDKLNCEKIELLDRFSKENENKQLFFKTDHHWTLDGAYIAYQEFSKNDKQFEFKELSCEFLGTLFNKIGVGVFDTLRGIDVKVDIKYEIGNEVYDSIYDENALKKADKYSYFLHGNHPLAKITNEGADGKKILIIKDSYANSLIPFMIDDYKEIHIIDPRYYGESISDYVNSNSIDEVLFVYNLSSLGSDLGIKRIK